MAKNILFIMCDQLRADYLSCYGHPHLHTPNIDALAATRARLYEALSKWSRTTRTRTTVSDAQITEGDAAALVYDPNLDDGILIGYWDEADLAAEYAKRDAYRAK